MRSSPFLELHYRDMAELHYPATLLIYQLYYSGFVRKPSLRTVLFPGKFQKKHKTATARNDFTSGNIYDYKYK